MPRFVSLRHPVEFRFDNETIIGEKGEPLAFALLAAGRLVLSRSPKLHRPHGPSCLRGGCDGCVLRVNGEPNVMTCLVPCEGGETVSTQNVLGSRRVDLMQVTDWFFPHGLDHHRFLAGVPAASFVVQKMARHFAGVGRLPDEVRNAGRCRREDVDVLVVGGGPAGLAVSSAIAKSSELRLLVVDDGVSPGGSMRARGASVSLPDRVRVYARTAAVGIYDREILLIHEDESIVVRARAVVLATGTHDGVLAFPGNDLPGVMSARAGALLARSGIVVGRRIAILGQGPYRDSFLDATRGHVDPLLLPAGTKVAAHGSLHLTSLAVAEVSSERGSAQERTSSRPPPRRAWRRHDIDGLLVDAPGAPSFELAEQAGVAVAFDPSRGGYVPRTDERGRALDWVWCAGELAGTGPDLSAIVGQATAVAADVLAALSATS